MQNKGGRQLASSLPTTGKITRYKAGDTLISNIRPYFKKIWYAPFEGTCSGDVIVFRANDPSNAPYLHACLRQDSFFDYVMQGAKGTKMPRGDKKQMMEFKVASSCSAEDLILLDSVIKQRSDNDSEITKLQKLRDTLLPKLMSGEIDVSKIDLTQLTNNHLAGRMHWSNVIRVRAIHAVHSQQSQIPAYESVPKVSHSPCRTALTLGGIAPLLSWLAVSQFTCLCSISCCGFSHDDFSGLGRACRPRNGLNWMVLVSPPERTGKDYDQHAPSTVYPSFAAERGIRRVDRAENTCQRADGA